MKLLLIGQAPAQQGDLTKALEGSVLALKLCKLFGCTLPQYLEETERMNVLGWWPGRGGKGDLFPKAEAEREAARLWPTLKGRKVLFVGLATARVFGVPLEICTWRQHLVNGRWICAYAILPHVSGVNRWWNDRKHQQQAEAFMRQTWHWRNAV